MIALNVFFTGFSWWAASTCETWSGAWWLNMFASALNGVIVLTAVL